jgi:hypothetical protein
MTTSRITTRSIALALLIAAFPAAQAGTPSIQNAGAIDACLKAVDFPRPFGEWDLKGNAKLPAYCECFMAKFQVRAEKAMKYMQANPGKAPPGTLEETNAEELAMRNSCRKQLGLPLAVDPNK